MYTSPHHISNRSGSSPNFNTPTPNSLASPSGGAYGGSAWQPPSAATGNHALLLNAQAQLSKQKQEMTHNLDMGPDRLGLEFLLDGQKINKISTGTSNSINQNHDPALYQALPSLHPKSTSGGSHGGHNIPGLAQEMTGYAAPVRTGPATVSHEHHVFPSMPRDSTRTCVSRGDIS